MDGLKTSEKATIAQRKYRKTGEILLLKYYKNVWLLETSYGKMSKVFK